MSRKNYVPLWPLLPRLKQDWDILAGMLDSQFPRNMNTDSYTFGDRTYEAKAQRNNDGYYDVYEIGGQGRFVVRSRKTRDIAKNICLEDATSLLKGWTDGVEEKGFKTDKAPAFGGGAHYRNVALIKEFRL